MEGAVLSKERIQHEILCGNVSVIKRTTYDDIQHIDDCQLQPAGIDLTLSHVYRRYKSDPCKIVLTNEIDYKDYTITYTARKDERIIIRPNETILGITQEHIKLPSNICGILNGRSRFARLGLCVHITALFINPGVDNQTVLEIHNGSPFQLELVPNERICQLILLNMDGNAKYEGKFNLQEL